MGRFSEFLRLCAILFVSFFVVDAFGAGYTCPSYKQYTSCNAGYYLSGTGVGNSCVICPVGSYCPGGTYTAPHDCDSGSTTANSSNIWTTGGTGETARNQCYRNVVISRKYNGGNSSATGTMNVLNPVTGGTIAWSSGDLTIQVYYNTAFTLPASSGLTFDSKWYEVGGWVSSLANSTYGSNSSSMAVTFTNTSTAASQTYYPVLKAKSTITLNCQDCDTPGTSSLYYIYGIGMYLDSAYTKKMTTSANPITIPVKPGYNFGGYYKNSGCSGGQIINANGYYVDDPRVYENTTLYACWTAKSYSCSAGTYLPRGATTCATCVAGYYCPGETYDYNPNANSGIYECAGYTYSAAGASACSNTSSGYYATGGTTCTNNGTRCTGQTICEGGYYCSGGRRRSCPAPTSAIRTAAFPAAYNLNNGDGVPTISLSNVTLGSSSLSQRTGQSAVTGCQALFFWEPNGAPAGLYEYVYYNESTGKYETTDASEYAWAYYYVTPGYQLTTPVDNAVCYGGQRYYKAVQKCPQGSYCAHYGNSPCTNGETIDSVFPNTECRSLTPGGTYNLTAGTGASDSTQCYGYVVGGVGVVTQYADADECPAGYYCPYADDGGDVIVYYGDYGDSGNVYECPTGFTSDYMDTTSINRCYYNLTVNKNGLSGTVCGTSGTADATCKVYYNVKRSLPTSGLTQSGFEFDKNWCAVQGNTEVATCASPITSITTTTASPAVVYANKTGYSTELTFEPGNGSGSYIYKTCEWGDRECFDLPQPTGFTAPSGYMFAGWAYVESGGSDGVLWSETKLYQPGMNMYDTVKSYGNPNYMYFVAIWQQSLVSCPATKYAQQGASTCTTTCTSGYYCPGMNGTTANGPMGRIACSTLFDIASGAQTSVISSSGSDSKTDCCVESDSGYQLVISSDGKISTTLSPANYAWYQERYCYGDSEPWISNASTCADDTGGGYKYSEPGNYSPDGCYGTIRLEKNDGSGVINGVGGTGAAVLTVYNLGIGITLPSTSGLTQTGYTFNDTWGTDPECSGTTYSANTVYYDISSEELYACKTLKRIECASVNCDGGNACYLPAGSETPQCCPAGSYCTDSGYYFNPYETQGLYKCPAGFTSLEGGSNKMYRCFVELQAGEILEYTYDENDTEYYGTAVIRDCDSVELSNMMDSSSGASMTKGYYCGGGQYLYGTTSGLGIKSSDPNKYWFGYSKCPGSFNSAPSTISSYGQCAFTLNPGDSVDICYYTDISTFGSCTGNTSSYCPGYTATIDEIGAESNTTWCSGNNGNDYINWSGINTCPPNSTTSADQTHCTCNYGYHVSDGASTITNKTQTCEPNQYTCAAGKYLPAGATACVECGASDAYCPGATCSFSATMDCGRESCPDPKEDERVQADNVDWVDSAKLPDERKNTSVISDATLKTWRNNLQSINQCFVTYTIQNDAGTMLLESIYYDSDSEQYTDDRALIPYYTRLNPGYYLHTSYSATYCSSGNAMYYQFAEECPQNSYCPGLKSMPACDDPNYSYGDDIGRYECLIATAGYYPWSAAKSSSVDQCYLETSGGYAVYEQGAGQVMCQAGHFCTGGTPVYYGEQSGLNVRGGFEYCPSGYPESAPGNSESGLCYVTLEAGEYVAGQGTGAAPCPADDYCPGGEKIYYVGSDEYPERGGNYPCPDPYLDNTDLGKKIIGDCKMDVPGGYYVAESGATQYVATDPGYYQPTPHSVGYGQTSVEVLGYEYIACSGQDKYQDLTAQTLCKTVSGGYYTTKNGAECTDGVACTGQAGCDGGYYCTAGERKACPDARTHKRTSQFTSTNSNLIMPTVTLDMLEELTNTSVTLFTNVGDITGCQVLSWYTAKPVAEGGKASLYEYAKYVGDEENGEYSNTTAWGYMSVQPGYYLSSPAACGAYAYYHVLNECESGQYCPGKDRVVCDSSNQATVHTSTFGMEICPTNYGASPARATAQNQCYLTTTAGTYVAEPYAAPVTCPGGSWCPSAQVNYGETGAVNACPDAQTHKMTLADYSQEWYPIWQQGYEPENPLMEELSVSVIDWASSKGKSKITDCRVIYGLKNDAGILNVESVYYNPDDEKYNNYSSSGTWYYTVLNPGFFYRNQLHVNYCRDGGTYKYYKSAEQCPAGSYCPGFETRPLCADGGEYGETMGINSCSSLIVQDETGHYPYSPVGSSQATQCYLTTKPGEAIYSTEYPEACPQNFYCTGGVNVNYGSSGGYSSCAALTPNGFYSMSGLGSSAPGNCYGMLNEGSYIDTPYSEEQKLCPAGSYQQGGLNIYYGDTKPCSVCTNAPVNSTYDISVSGWTNANCPWECNDGYNQTVDANGNPMCGQMCTVSGMNYIKSSTGLSIPLYSSKGAGWARAIGVSLDGGQTACYGRLEQDTGNAPSGSLRVNVGGTKYYAVE